MNQLSIIYLVMCSVLLVSVMLVSISPISPDNPGVITTSAIGAKGGAYQGYSNINLRGAITPGFGKISFLFAPDRGQVNEIFKIYLNTSRNSLWMNGERLLFDVIRKAEKYGIDTPRPFLRPGY